MQAQPTEPAPAVGEDDVCGNRIGGEAHPVVIEQHLAGGQPRKLVALAVCHSIFDLVPVGAGFWPAASITA